MDIYNFLNLANDLSWVAVSVFDCDSTNVVFNAQRGDDVVFDIMEKGLDGYEVESFDLSLDKNNKLCLELNISMGDD